MFNPPECISNDEFLAAIRPLLEAVGTTPEAIYAEGFEYVPSKNPGELGHLRFLSVVDPEDGTTPVVLGEDEFAVKAWPVAVAVH